MGPQKKVMRNELGEEATVSKTGHKKGNLAFALKCNPMQSYMQSKTQPYETHSVLTRAINNDDVSNIPDVHSVCTSWSG